MKTKCEECEYFKQCEIKIILHNFSDSDFSIQQGARIAQITIMQHSSYLMGIDSDDIREGGFGSSSGSER